MTTVRVLGGPGTGKSSLLLETAATHIAAGLDPQSVLLLTGSGRLAASARSALTARLLAARSDQPCQAVVRDPLVVATRNKVQAVVDETIDEAEVKVSALLKNGQRIDVHVEHAIGSLQKPLSDAQLQAKFAALVVPVLGQARAQAITQACWALGSAADVRSLTELCRA